MVGDSVANLITSLKNASNTGKSVVFLPATNLTSSILKVLKKNSYIEDFEIVGEKPKTLIKINLKYENGKPAIHDVKRVSKFSQRIYSSFKALNPIKSGYGIVLLTTPNGILTDKEAKEQKVGGEVLFKIW